MDQSAYEQMGAPDARRVTWQEAEAALGHRVHDRRWGFVVANDRVMTYAEPLAYDPPQMTVALVTHDVRVSQIPMREAFMRAAWSKAVSDGHVRP